MGAVQNNIEQPNVDTGIPKNKHAYFLLLCLIAFAISTHALNRTIKGKDLNKRLNDAIGPYQKKPSCKWKVADYIIKEPDFNLIIPILK